MNEPPIPVSMNAVTAMYATRTTLVTTVVGDPSRLLKADPRRVYVRFQHCGTTPLHGPIIPGAAIHVAGDPAVAIESVEWKWRDCPHLVTGEFYCVTANGENVLIIEELYLGD